ncbi:MAG: tRNA (adenosine(37)-N6)-threonylcarbamoyltransferase complex dimerization subunit type 1 TsaB [Kiritimatiellae bacterium]|nr:tRNA (adenosine(37)-N6)-threonylcarbamoyltransferase complex dimerization subunit type 1 TsaB [Kiritimatiellia bacterium]
MRILAIDASSPVVSLAVCENGRPLAARTFSVPPRQSAQLLDAVPPLLDEAGLSFSGLDLVAVGRGPGSYTGLRVAMAAARAWALPFSIPVWTAPGPRATAATLFAADPARKAVRLAGPVRRGFCWTAVFRRSPGNPAIPVQDGDWTTVPEESVDSAALDLPSGTPVNAAHLAFLHSLGVPSDPLSPLYLHPAVNIPPRFDPLTGTPLS